MIFHIKFKQDLDCKYFADSLENPLTTNILQCDELICLWNVNIHFLYHNASSEYIISMLVSVGMEQIISEVTFTTTKYMPLIDVQLC